MIIILYFYEHVLNKFTTSVNFTFSFLAFNVRLLFRWILYLFSILKRSSEKMSGSILREQFSINFNCIHTQRYEENHVTKLLIEVITFYKQEEIIINRESRFFKITREISHDFLL